jgi:hypothetical protein
MKTNLKTLLLSSAFALALLAPAQAQFQPQGVTPKSTYGASAVGLVTAASATDIMTLRGSASKTIVVTFVECTGIATTAGTADLALIKRTTANTGGTSTNPAVTQFDSKNPAGTGVVTTYTANPATLGTSSGVAAVKKLNLPLVASTLAQPATWSMTDYPYTQPIILRGVGESLAINGNGATLAAGAAVDCTFNWIEY